MVKKADTSLNLIASVLITVVAIGLILALAPRIIKSDKMYCSTAYRLRSSIWADKRDQLCDEKNDFEVTTIEKKPVVLNKLSTNEIEKSIFFDNNMNTIHLSVPKNAEIKNAGLSLSLSNLKLTEFNDEQDTALSEQVINFDRGGSHYTITFSIPREAIVTNAKLRLSGKDIPGKTDMVFVLDNSASMVDEWSSLCSGLLYISTQTKGITDLNVTAYVLVDPDFPKDTDYRGSCIVSSEMAGIIDKVQKLYPENLSYFFRQNPDAPPFIKLELSSDIVPTHDYYPEAWGLGIYWLIVSGEHYWRPNSKIIIVPISDSDPTGGGCNPNDCDNNPPGDSIFSGNEQLVIDGILDNINEMEFIFPVYGNLEQNDKEQTEGYMVGLPLDECMAYSRCSKVIGWMEELAQASNSKVFSYKDTRSLTDAIGFAINSSYPEDVVITLNGDEMFSFPGELNSTNSPVIVEFEEMLNEALSSCATDVCTFELNFGSMSEGSLLVDRFFVDYVVEADDVSMGIDAIDSSLGEIQESQIVEWNFTEQLTEYLRSCATEICIVPVIIDASDYIGALKVQRIDIEYEKYLVAETLLQHILSCWEKSERGSSTKGIMCEEFVLPSSVSIIEPITEQRIETLLKERNLCGLLGTGNGCGSDSIDFERPLQSQKNILIEYDGKQKKVVVS
ncbi:hypothetical protein JXA85_06630 [Candidatus Woesearchaeota archaeon]|nr:hypothetical protein [Candidatus Woesearchaeota archaeon]